MLKDFVRKMDVASSTNPGQHRFIEFIKAIFSVEKEDIGCEECYAHLDVYTDMIAEGKDPSIVMRDVKAHLAQCPCCEEEFQALLSMIKSLG